MSLKYAGLFEGIGGFALAAQWAGFTPVWSNEIDPFCCKVLRKNFTHEIIEADIRECGKGRKHELRPVDIICGGFPCQPFSVAGRRQGINDDRYLGEEMLRIFEEYSPRFVVAENVYGLLNIDGHATVNAICSSLESIGYAPAVIFDCQSDTLGLSTMERHIWIISEAINKRRERSETVTYTYNGNEGKFQGANTRVIDRWDISKTQFCRVGERVSQRLDKYQRERLHALGNAIPPKVAFEIFKAIKEIAI